MELLWSSYPPWAAAFIRCSTFSRAEGRRAAAKYVVPTGDFIGPRARAGMNLPKAEYLVWTAAPGKVLQGNRGAVAEGCKRAPVE